MKLSKYLNIWQIISWFKCQIRTKMRNTGRHNKILLYRHEIWKYSTGPPPIHHSYKVIILWARKDFSNFSQAETRIAHGVHDFCSIRMKWGKFCQVVSEKIFRNRPTRNKNCLWWRCLFDEKSNIYREPSINSSYQVLASGFRGEDN